MFGLSLGEIVLLLIVGMVVVGPKNLPSMMRTAGQWVNKLRRMSNDLRAQSGLDDLIRQEGLENEIEQLRSLSRTNVLETFIASGTVARPFAAPPALAPPAGTISSPAPGQDRTRVNPWREREYPVLGCDACGAVADAPAIVSPYADVPDDAHPPLEAG